MNEETRADIGAMLMKLDFVTWDRFINPSEDEYFIYGYIGSYAFVVLSWYHGNWWYLTSATQKEYTDKLAQLIDGTEEDLCPHYKCVSEFDIPNMVR